MSSKKMSYLVVIIVFIFYVEPLLSIVFYQYDESEGFSIIAFVTLYEIGAYLRQQNNIKQKQCVVLLLGSSSMILASKIILQAITERGILSLGTGLLYHNNSVFVLINAIALFFIFKEIHITSATIQKMIKWCTPSVFAVYLLHENPTVRKLIWSPELLLYLKRCGFGWYVVIILVLSITVFAISLLIDKLLINKICEMIYQLPIMKEIRKMCDRYDSAMSL